MYRQYKTATFKIRGFLSHHPTLYALIVGIAIVLFWRGVWHSADHIHYLIESFHSVSSMTLAGSPWWDGPLSFVVGAFILHITGAFTSSFIGNELILSGLRGEKKLTERAETDIKHETAVIADIKQELFVVSSKLEKLQKELDEQQHS